MGASSVSPTIGGPENVTMDTNEPGGSTCFECGDELAPGDYVYRQVFGEVADAAAEIDHGVIFDPTGGVPVRHYCQECHNDLTRDNAARHVPESPERLYAILAAADGRLVADTKLLTIGARLWFRVVSGEIGARRSIPVVDAEGPIRFTTESYDMTRAEFDHLFTVSDDVTEIDHRPVLLRPVDETPFADADVDSGGGSE